MQYDRLITISTANSRKSTHWPASTLLWSELVERLRVPVRGTETLSEYLQLPKAKQDELKDVGGFVAGTLAGERRKANSVTGRDVITLDMDNIPAGGTQDILRRVDALGCAYAVYSTRKHEEAQPRLRILVPLSRTATADEYEPIARKLVSIIGIEFCDPSTFEASRLMYWPSCCSDSQYVYTYGDKPFLDTDGILGMYTDWRNIAEWPQVPGVQEKFKRYATKQGNPTEKSGVIGAFCRVYDIYKAMNELIPREYLPTDIPDRYTYAGGSTTGGAIVYDNGQFLYSHHATDPCSGRLVNAFDLVRLHKFGELDDDAKPDTPTNRLPSYTAMCEFAISDPAVSTLLNQERYEKATQAFSTPIEAADANWMSLLAVSPTTGTPAKTMDNICIILENDPLLKGKFGLDEFANRGIVLGSLPWDERAERRVWSDTDDAGAQWYIEKVYGITGKDKILNAIALISFKNRFNDVQDYLTSLKWDGTPRLDTLFIDYLGAEDNVYTRQVVRKSLAAAVARAMQPGVKYDCMPILSGPQGIGKSTLLRQLGKRWFSDSLLTFEGKEACEMIQGVWINELSELNGLSKSEMSAVKQFLSKSEDIFRVPYGRRSDLYPRRCVFFGTTNDAEFLRDNTGERRFWPVDVGVQKPVKSVFNDLPLEVDQIWAEAYVIWQLGEFLDLENEARTLWEHEVKAHKISNSKEGLIREFLERPIPVDWDKWSLERRRMYWSETFKHNESEVIKREKVCAAEIWCECFGNDIKWMKQTDTREINVILDSIEGWEKDKKPKYFGKVYGLQRGYSAVTD